MPRYPSQCCACSFSYGITCPGLKVPIQPEIVGCASATCVGVLPSLTLNQCGNAIWAFGDGLSAVNGIVTGTDSSLTASCDFACCFTRTCPCVQYPLSCCLEVYQNPGVYYHRIRYVTDSFEVSDFSEPGCFCICQGCHYPCSCAISSLGFCNICYVANENSTDGVNSCLDLEVAEDSDFNTIIKTCTVTSEAASNCSFGINMPVHQDSASGSFYDAGTTLYTRAKSYGAYNCTSVLTSPTCEINIAGDLYVFALCSGVSPCADTQGCNCIQLYATYASCCKYCCLSSATTEYKFDVSPFTDFCSDVTTECGTHNVFIPKSTLAAAGACPDYYVRACVLGDSIAPQRIRCVKLGNVTHTAIEASCNNPDCDYGRCCSTTISHTGPIAVFGIGSGGVGSWTCPDMHSCTCVCVYAVCEIYKANSGASGCICLTCLENPGGCLNGCTFCMKAGHANCGSVRCVECSCGEKSYFCIAGVLCVYACGAGCKGCIGGLKGARACGSQCMPWGCYRVAGLPGTSGHAIISDADSDGYTSINWTRAYHCWCCNARVSCSKFYKQSIGKTQFCEDGGACFLSPHDNRLISYCCESSCIGSCGKCSWNCDSFPLATDFDCCGGTSMCVAQCPAAETIIGLNWYGFGGLPSVVCANSSSCGPFGAWLGPVCNATRGFGWGAGGPSYIDCPNNNVYMQCCHCDDYSGYRGWSQMCPGQPQNCSCMFYWPACNTISYANFFYACPGLITSWGKGGAAGMLFMCNCCQVNDDICVFDKWQGSPGIMMIACLDY